MRTIRLYGWLGERFGREFRLAVTSPADAVRALCAMLPGFRDAVGQDKGPGFHVRVGYAFRGEDELRDPCGAGEPIRIVPATAGSGAAGKIIAGAVLIVAGVVVSGLSFGSAAPLGGAMISMGIGLIVGGVIELLAPKPKRDSADASDRPRSYTFGNSLNTVGQGVAVPVGYGRMLVPSHVISAQIFSEALPLPASSSTPAPGDIPGTDESPVSGDGNEAPGADYGGWGGDQDGSWGDGWGGDSEDGSEGEDGSDGEGEGGGEGEGEGEGD